MSIDHDPPALDEEQHVPPAIIDAERIVLGCAMLNRAAREEAATMLTAADFFRPAHQMIFDAINTIGDEGRFVEPIAVIDELTRRKEINRVGGPVYILKCEERVPVARNVGHYADMVRRDARRRRLLQATIRGTQIASDLSFQEEDLEAVRDEIERATAVDKDTEGGWLEDLLPDFVQTLDTPADTSDRVDPPYKDLETYIPGFKPGQLVVIGARPSIGKTVVGMDIARHAAIRQGLPTYVASLEMSKEELQARIIAAESRVPLSALQRDKHRMPTEEEWARIARHGTRIASSPILIDDTSQCTVQHIRSRLRGMERAGRRARLAVVDYLQLMTMPKAESRERQVAETAWKLKMLAKEFHIPVVVLAQLNRKVEDRTDKTPQLADLRESGAVEQDSDIVLLLNRPDFYDLESPRAGELDVIVAKNRGGHKGTATVAFQGKYTRAVDMAA